MATKEQTEILVRLGKIDAGISQINDHLKQLNGSVARHQEQIGILSTAVARLEGEDDGVQALWNKYLLPLLWQSELGTTYWHGN